MSVIQQSSVNLKRQAKQAKGSAAIPFLIFSAIVATNLIALVLFTLVARLLPVVVTTDMLAQFPQLQTAIDLAQNLVSNIFPIIQNTVVPVSFAVVMCGMIVIWAVYFIFFQKELKKDTYAFLFPVMSGIITLMIAVIAYMRMGMWPLGDKSAMIVDMHHQYAPLLAQFRDMLLNGGSALYTFEAGYGTGFIPLFAYYLASPFNVLLILFPQAYLAEGILLITLIKMALTGAFMTLCVQYIFKRRDYSAVAVGVLYALSMYMLAYSWDIMWLDCVMVLPLCVMGFEYMMRQGKYWLYVVSLAYALYSNYYIGFMVCIFLTLYFVLYTTRTLHSDSVKGFFTRFLTALIRFAIGSLIGGGIAAFILLPAFMSLGSTSAAGGANMSWEMYYNVFELIGRGMFGVEPTIRSGNLPNTYCGVLAMVSLPIFFTINSIPLKRRLGYLGLLCAMVLSLVVKPLDLIWHGFHSPNDLPFRYSFIFIFVLLLIVYEVLYKLEDIKPVHIGVSLFGIALFMVLQQNEVQEKFADILSILGLTFTEEYSEWSLYITFAIALVYGVVLFLASQKIILKQAACMLLTVIVIGELIFSTGETLRQMNNNEHYTSHADYLDNDITKTVQGVVDRMEEIGDAESEGDFYRVEFMPRRTTTDTSLFDYRGVTIFASSGSYEMTRFMGSMGYAVNGVNSVLYKSFVPTCDSLVGIKYIALEADLPNHPYLNQLEKFTYKNEKTNEERAFYIYENPYALSVGFMVSDSVKDWEYSYYDPMASQNSLFKTMTSTTDNVLECLPITAVSDTISSTSGTTAFSINGKHTADFKATVDRDGQYFIHVDCRAAKSIQVTAGGNSWGVTPYEPFIIDGGMLSEGTEVNIMVTAENACAGNIFIARLNDEAVARDFEILSDSCLKIESFDDSNLRGTVQVEKAGTMMTSICYDAGWRVTVDGEVVETYAVGNAVLGFDLPAGEHVVEMTYVPKGLILGVGISVLFLNIFVALTIASFVFWKIRKRKAAAQSKKISCASTESASVALQNDAHDSTQSEKVSESSDDQGVDKT